MNKLCPKIVRKALKWPLQYANFQKFLGGACPRSPLKLFLLLKLLEITLPGKDRALKMTKFGTLSLQKNSEYAPDMKHFERTYLRPFPGLHVFVFS